jgi:hypothetical protein
MSFRGLPECVDKHPLPQDYGQEKGQADDDIVDQVPGRSAGLQWDRQGSTAFDLV